MMENKRSVQPSGNPTSNKPNILFIIADDLGVDALRVTSGTVVAQVDGPSGAKAPAPLPTLGKLLQSGIHFSHAWAQPVCSPTRASLFTGLHAWKTDVGYPNTRPLPSNEVTASGAPGAPIQTLAKVLKGNAGYRCGMFGKWDLGGGEGLGGQTPIDWGWDHFEGIYGGGLRPVAGLYGLQLSPTPPPAGQPPNNATLERLRQTTDAATKQARDLVVTQCKNYLEQVCDPRFVEGQPDVRFYIWPKQIDDLATKTKTVDVVPFQRAHLYATADQVESARAWIQQQSGQPWCVALTLTTPHDPYHVPPKESYKIQLPDVPTPQQMFIAMLESMDFYIGRLLNAPELRDQLKNTVIVFVGDNGTQDADPATGAQMDGIPGDDKTSYHVGGVHVPMIVADGGLYFGGPPCYLKDAAGKSTAGWRCESPVHIMDLYKTALDIAATTPIGETDSVSMKGLLQKSGGARRYLLSQQYPDQNFPLASKNASVSDGTYKLSCYRSKLVDGGAGDEFLYAFCKLAQDPTIPGNIIEQPLDLNDLGNRAKILELYGELQKLRMDAGDPKPARAPLPLPSLPWPSELPGSTPRPLYGFAPNRMDVFWKAPDGSLQDTWWNGNTWVVSKLSAQPMASAPAPLYGFAPNRMDVFWRSPSGALMDTWWTGTAWMVSQLSAQPMASDPAPLYGFAKNRMDVFWKAPDGTLMDTWWTGTAWVVSQLSAQPMASAPAPLYGFAPNRMDVFWRAPNGALMDTWWNGTAWVVSQISAQPMASDPAPLYGFAKNRMDVFWKAPDGALMDTWWTGTAWVVSKLSAQPMASAPVPLYGFAPNRMDVFWKALDGTLMDTWWNGTAWVVSQLSTQPMASDPAPLYGFAKNRMDVFWKAQNGALMDTWWNGTAWIVSAL